MTGAPWTTAYIGLGANLGARRETLRAAIRALRAAQGVRVASVSRLYETAPVGGPEGQDRYLNAAAALETRLAPLALLDLLQSIEADHLRTREIRWGPRTLDLDILFFGDAVMASDRLILPHPRAAERRFVLQPLADIAPAFRHPTLDATVAELLRALPLSDAEDILATEDQEDWSAE